MLNSAMSSSLRGGRLRATTGRVKYGCKWGDQMCDALTQRPEGGTLVRETNQKSHHCDWEGGAVSSYEGWECAPSFPLVTVRVEACWHATQARFRHEKFKTEASHLLGKPGLSVLNPAWNSLSSCKFARQTRICPEDLCSSRSRLWSQPQRRKKYKLQIRRPMRLGASQVPS